MSEEPLVITRKTATDFMGGIQFGSLNLQPNLAVRLAAKAEWLEANPDKGIDEAPPEACNLEVAVVLVAIDQGAVSARSTIYGLKKVASAPVDGVIADIQKALDSGSNLLVLTQVAANG